MNDVYSLAQLFADRVFTVPDYQRGYAWEPVQIAELLEDLDTLPAGKEHYTGTLVLHQQAGDHVRIDDAGHVYSVHHVVDGQQRLTSLVILLSVLASQLEGVEGAEPLRLSTLSTYVLADGEDGMPLFKLTLNSDSKEFFRDAILGPGLVAGATIASHQRLEAAKKAFMAHFADRRNNLGASYDAYLRDLHRAVTAQMKWTLYEVESAADVGVIFEVMNDRGKPLSELDKVKNYLMYVGSKLVDFDHHDLDEDINDAWTELFRQLMQAGLSSTANEDQLLRAHWLMAYDPQPRKWSGARSVKQRIKLTTDESRRPALLADLSEYAKSLSQASIAYADVQRPSRADAYNALAGDPLRDQTVRWGDRLVRLNVVAPFAPLLMAVRHRAPAESNETLELLKLAEAFAFRVYALLRRRADVGQADMFRLAHAVYRETMSIDDALTEMRVLLMQLCPDGEFEQQLRADRNWYDWGPLVYFLYEYERHLLAGQGVEPDVSWQELRRIDRKETIEHILPQTPIDAYWTERFPLDERAMSTNALGNLMLTKNNSSYGRKPYPAKRGEPGATNACYRNGAFRMERKVADVYDDWTPSLVVARSEDLILWALERWHVESTDLPEDRLGLMLVDTEPDEVDELREIGDEDLVAETQG